MVTVIFIKKSMNRCYICNMHSLVWSQAFCFMKQKKYRKFYYLLVFNIGYKVRKSNTSIYSEAQFSSPHISFVLCFFFFFSPSLKKITNSARWWACPPSWSGSRGRGGENELLLATLFFVFLQAGLDYYFLLCALSVGEIILWKNEG